MTDMDIEFGDYLRFVFALLFVLALIGVLVAVARRFGLGFGAPTRNGRHRRLSIVEVIPIDGKRRMVLLRRDFTEHLILLGTGPDLLIESGIPAPTNGTAAAPGKTSAATQKMDQPGNAAGTLQAHVEERS